MLEPDPNHPLHNIEEMYALFEPSDELDIKVAKDIGPNKKSLVVVDNFYKYPDKVREFTLKREKLSDPKLLSYLPGVRVFCPTRCVQMRTKHIFTELCFDKEIWGREFNRDVYEDEWDKAGYMANVINDVTLLRSPDGIIPHQDTYETEWPNMPAQFGAVIYLNTPEECQGGTNLWSFDGTMSLKGKGPTGIVKSDEDATEEEVFGSIHKQLYETSDRWKVEHEIEMVYNRMALYEADNLHSQNVDLGMFTDYDRVNQVLFM
jgi:hypothetical protein|tara:strand:- start:3107 stop:3892 length:786 start_codon:yes stop_codon:yes gene_type:complete